jgi:hypothetical protein
MISINDYKNGIKTEAVAPKSNSGLAALFTKLFESRSVTHHAHLMAQGPGSFAQHLALQAYYEGVVPLADGLFEMYAGQYGLVKFNPIGNNHDGDILSYMESLGKMLIEAHDLFDKKDSHLHNTLDEIISLVQSTVYKLKYLK